MDREDYTCILFLLILTCFVAYVILSGDLGRAIDFSLGVTK